MVIWLVMYGKDPAAHETLERFMSAVQKNKIWVKFVVCGPHERPEAVVVGVSLTAWTDNNITLWRLDGGPATHGLAYCATPVNQEGLDTLLALHGLLVRERIGVHFLTGPELPRHRDNLQLPKDVAIVSYCMIFVPMVGATLVAILTPDDTRG